MKEITLKNLITDSSFEKDQWSGANYSDVEYKFGNRTLYFPTGTTVVSTIPVERPILNHKYYGRRYIKSAGLNEPSDCRFEVYAGDGIGLNWVYAWNNGNHKNWEFNSAIHEITEINYDETITTNVRCFNVGTTADTWIDGVMLIDLTASFGAGNEPTQEWCDKNIPYFENETTIKSLQKINFKNITITPNPVEIDNLIIISLEVNEELMILTPEEKYLGEFYLSEV